MDPRAIRIGQTYWLDDVPPLDGGDPRRGTVIVVAPPHDGEVVVVATTTGEDPDETDAVFFEDEFPSPCYAIPRWTFMVRCARLTEPARRDITGVKLKDLLDRIEDASYVPRHRADDAG